MMASSSPQPQPLLQPQRQRQPQPLLQPQRQPQPLLQPQRQRQPQPLLQPQPQPLLQPQRQRQPQPLLQPQPQSTYTSAAQSSSSRFIVPVMHKNCLQEYTQRLGIEMPVYQTRTEGICDPKFNSTVEVDGCIYSSPNTFSSKKAAEQDAAKFALEHISKKTKDEGCPHICEDNIFCKSILKEFADKMNQKKPIYNTVMQELDGFTPVFMSTVVFNGLCYTGEFVRKKKEAEQLAARAAITSLLGKSGSGTVLFEIIKSKDKLHKLKDASHENISAVPQAVGVSIGQPSDVLPFEFVPAVLPEPSDVGPSSLKKRRKNKKKPNKKLRSNTTCQLPAFL